jgi:hypothetical protein
MSGLIHRNDALKEKITASNIVMGTGSDKTDTVEKRIAQLEDNKQGLLIEGENIRITENQDGTAIISAIVDSGTDVTVTPLLSDGTHIADIMVDGNNFEIYAPNGGGQGTVTDVLVDGESVVNQDGEAEIDLSGKQDVLTAGQNITIQNNVISATDTTYVDFVGATDQSDGLSGLVPSPAIADKDKFLKGDGTWGEAGGGNVDDILMNGQSIVTNKVASFQNYVELTQSEYDALPASKLTDGILYCIKDTGIVEGDKYAPVIYSLEEREIGVFTDGKPLYERSYSVSTPSAINTANQIIPIPAEMNIVNLFGMYDNQFPINFFYAENNRISTWVNNAKTYVVNMALDNGMLNKNGVVTLQYTKTTDTTGSGTCGTDGVPMVHYDGNEKIIGTWFGETLYEKTINCGALPNNSTKNVNHNIANLKRIVNFSGCAYRSVGDIVNIPLPYVGNNSNLNTVLYVSSTAIGIATFSDRSAFTESYVTIQYTKSS